MGPIVFYSMHDKLTGLGLYGVLVLVGDLSVMHGLFLRVPKIPNSSWLVPWQKFCSADCVLILSRQTNK